MFAGNTQRFFAKSETFKETYLFISHRLVRFISCLRKLNFFFCLDHSIYCINIFKCIEIPQFLQTYKCGDILQHCNRDLLSRHKTNLIFFGFLNSGLKKVCQKTRSTFQQNNDLLSVRLVSFTFCLNHNSSGRDCPQEQRNDSILKLDNFSVLGLFIRLNVMQVYF